MRIKKKMFNCLSILLILLTIINSNFSVSTIMAKDDTVASTKQTVTIEDNKQVTQYHYQDEEVDVVVTLQNTTDLPEEAVLKVSAVDMDDDMTDAVNENVADKKLKIENKAAYDISFLVNGKEVEPANSVDVKVNLLKNESKTSASVYHYDEKEKSVDDMNATLTVDKVVEFSTTHFSTYIIVNTSGENVNVTIEHYNEPYSYELTTDAVYDANTKNSSGQEIGGMLILGKANTEKVTVDSNMLFTTDRLALQSGSRIVNYAKAVNWEVSKVIQYTKDEKGNDIETTVTDFSKIYVTEDAKFRVYYKPVESTKDGSVKFYDYTVKPSDGTLGINADSNYKLFGTTNANKNRFSISEVGSIAGGTAKGKQVNAYTGRLITDADGNIKTGGAVEGIVTGLTADYSDVVFGKNYAGYTIDDPNVFNNKSVPGKTIYSDFKLSFSKIGDRYTLENVRNANNEIVANSGTSFYPLDKVYEGVIGTDLANTGNSASAQIKHNDFFAMRYDVNFTIGDYVGPLNYMFSGDDDLWVILDGEKVVIDLGGIHNCLTKSVDLWNFIKDANGNYDKNKEHTLTIIYMERGAYDSDCRMNFTLPNATITEVVDVPKTNIDILKVNSKNEPLANAVFKITSEETGKTITTTSNEKGIMSIQNLTEGIYTMVETSAPSGYSVSNEKWIIKVTNSLTAFNTVDATLYKADGITKVDKNTIVNYTNKEVIDKTLTYNKTATVRSWDNRTYDINLEASSTATSTTINSTPYDIVMVLDRSSSMGDGFDSFIEFTESEFEENTQYFYKTKNGMFQLIDVDLKKSRTVGIFTDTEDNDKKVNITLGINTVYVKSNYEKYDGDVFEGEKFFINDKDYYFAVTGSYYYKLDSGKYVDLRVSTDSDTEAYYLLNETGTHQYNVSLKNSEDKKKIYTSTMKKKAALVDAANGFLNNVTTLSPDSRIGIVDFSSKDKIITNEKDGKTMLNVGVKDNFETLKKWIETDEKGAFTRSDLGLQAAYNVLNDKSSWGEIVDNTKSRKTMVVFFTDGVITTDYGSYSPGNARAAGEVAEKIRKDFEASIYAIGVFDAANKTGSLQAIDDESKTNVSVKAINNDMLKIASPNCYLTADSADSLKKLFADISTDLEESLSGATISDVIDSRFELTSESEDELEASGATVTKNADGTTTVTWKDQSIKREINGEPGWSHKFTIIAKTDYVGGNNIPTNGPNSYIEVGDVIANFPLPYVNVKTNLNIPNQKKTVFLGESLPETVEIFDKLQEIININVAKYKVSKDAFTLTWTDAAGNIQSKKWNEIKPTNNLVYTATITYAAGKPTDQSNKNTTKNGTTYYIGKSENGYKDTKKATYSIYVVKGQIELKKNINSGYTNIEQINANQTFIFKIERFEVDENNEKKGTTPVEVYYETINFDANDTIKEKTKLISGLRKGYYTITEESSWSSKYKLVDFSDNYDKNKTEAIDLFIGDCLEAETSDKNPVYYGLEQDETYLAYASGKRGEVVFTNQLVKDWKWLSDTSAAINAFNK